MRLASIEIDFSAFEEYIESLYKKHLLFLLEFKEKAKPFAIIFIVILFLLIFIYILQQVPHWQVSKFGIADPKDLADTENNYRATLAQILGGFAILSGLYFTWRNLKVSQDNLKVSQEGQITERFTRAIDQLGHEKLEIRLGGIYALERISIESNKDYWPIMEILTTYVRKNSCVDSRLNEDFVTAEHVSMDIQNNEEAKSEVLEVRKISLDIQAILTVIGRRKLTRSEDPDQPVIIISRRTKNFYGSEMLKVLNLRMTCLQGADLQSAHLEWANLEGANLQRVNLKEACLQRANLEGANVNLANLYGANLKDATLQGANLQGTSLKYAHLEWANLEEAKLEGTNLEGAYGLSLDQLSKVKTLYNAKLDEKLEVPLREKYSNLFVKPHDYSFND